MTSKDEPAPFRYRLAVETFSAVVSAFLVAPMIAIVDQAVVSNASGLKKLVPALIDGTKTLIVKPHVFLRQPAFLTCWGVYASIYTIANNISAICERTETDPFYWKFFVTSLVSVNLNIAKDRYFARLFGIGAPKPMAYSSMACFGARNGMTILAAFSMPPHVSKILQSDFHVPQQRADKLTQLVIPVTMQIFNTPLHLLGYDIYNREHVSMKERISFIRREFSKTLIARIGHIFPAYGLGGVFNEHLRATGAAYVETWHKGSMATTNNTKTGSKSGLIVLAEGNKDQHR
uniref:Uncharacterized protein n=1 Tax=Spumella elongata TaxID=89044 RepID=A0A7S3H0G4_9STRA|mmetsp:Transcript_28862/g.49568  ORF Transcript_28862/g.49568 Transcript_28862/m.49568 type:complete len:290 (+) Transcript_28862:144-1013(+)